MDYCDFSALFYDICENKQNIVKLVRIEKHQFKKQFFNLNFPEWRLNLLWEYIWDDKTYEEIFHIFNEKKLLK